MRMHWWPSWRWHSIWRHSWWRWRHSMMVWHPWWRWWHSMEWWHSWRWRWHSIWWRLIRMKWLFYGDGDLIDLSDAFPNGANWMLKHACFCMFCITPGPWIIVYDALQKGYALSNQFELVLLFFIEWMLWKTVYNKFVAFYNTQMVKCNFISFINAGMTFFQCFHKVISMINTEQIEGKAAELMRKVTLQFFPTFLLKTVVLYQINRSQRAKLAIKNHKRRQTYKISKRLQINQSLKC